jgi:energy-coupling factor transporter ATP-binding protein EcfA2
MQEVIFIIGLPGSGKSTLIEHYKTHPFIDYKVYDDWMTWTYDDIDKDFSADVNYLEVIQNLEQGSNLLISGISFCDNEFLQKSEYYLKTNFPNLKITRVYFENDPQKAESNIRYRDKQNGGYWQENEKGEMWYHGTIFELKPLYQLEIKNANILSQNYIIPEGYPVFPIMVQEE